MITKTINTTIAALTVAVLGIFAAMPAQALTMAELDGYIAQGFTAEWIMANVGGSSSANTGSTSCGTSYGYTAHSSTLRSGMNGAAVSALQAALNNYAGATLTPDGAYGPATANAVRNFQQSMGLSVDGIAGPVTLGAVASASMMASTCTDPVSPSNPGSSDLNGGVGDITVDLSGEYSNEEVGEGENDVPVLAFDVEADDSSDVMINSIKVEFSQNTGADSDRLDDYVDEVTIWFDGDQVGSADADNFNESSDIYSKSIVLDNVIIRAGDEERLTIAVSALNNLDSGDIDTDQFNVGVSSIRFTDGDGVVTTDSYTLLLTDGTADVGSIEKLFDFTDFAGATDVELRASLENDSINDAHVLNVDDTQDTKHNILSFNLEARGDSDIWIDEIPVVITTTGETDESVIVSEANLWYKGDKVSSKSVVAGGEVLFDDLDLTMDAGDKDEFIVEVKLQDTDGALDDGDTVQATLTVASIDAEDEAGDSVTGGDLTGAAVGDAHAVYEVGFTLDFVSASETVQTSDTATDIGTFTLKYEVTAFDGDIFIDNTCTEDNDGSEVATTTSYSVSNDGSNTTNCVMTAAGTVTNADSAATFKVLEGTSRVFTLTVSVSATADSFAEVSLEAIGWDTAAGGDDNVFDFNLPGDFKSDPVFLNFTA